MLRFLPVSLSLCCFSLLLSASVMNNLHLLSARADCIVATPAFGSLGSCVSPLKSGDSCSFKCDFPYALSPTPSATQCPSDDVLTAQTCGMCAASASLVPSSEVNFTESSLAGSTYSGSFATAISGDQSTLAVGNPSDNNGVGSVTVYAHVAGAWVQQSPRLSGSDAVGFATLGNIVALSTDGSTLAVAAPYDGHHNEGAVWIFTRSSSDQSWSQQGGKLSGMHGENLCWSSMALSADGNTVAAQGYNGPMRVWHRQGTVWSQVGGGVPCTSTAAGSAAFSQDGTTLATGNHADYSNNGSVSVWIRNGNDFVLQTTLTETNLTAGAQLGRSVSLSADGNIIAIGAPSDGEYVGSAVIFSRSGGNVWTRQAVLTGTGSLSHPFQGSALSLSLDGNHLLLGGYGDNSDVGAAWLFSRDGSGVWSQVGSKLVPPSAVEGSLFGSIVSLSASGMSAVIQGWDAATPLWIAQVATCEAKSLEL
jgi:hypothetical protein